MWRPQAGAAAAAVCLLATTPRLVQGVRDVESDVQRDESSDSSFFAAESHAARTIRAAIARTVSGPTEMAAHSFTLAATALRRVARGFARDAPAECQQDVYSERLGCKMSSCECEWFEACYPKHVDKLGDVGVCTARVAVLVALSLAIIANTIICIVVLRVFFQWRERIRNLMRKSGANETDREEAEEEAADTKRADCRQEKLGAEDDAKTADCKQEELGAKDDAEAVDCKQEKLGADDRAGDTTTTAPDDSAKDVQKAAS
mmetsp:Transcript_124603/g.363839  ORF Transcript_124603/g.363839 Transcript_124603/m.363839 type:complete len:261 (+) Transcript_124603:188-970(+)